MEKREQSSSLFLYINTDFGDVHGHVFADEVLEQADYLYSCAETEKLYQMLLQYKDRWAES